LDPVVGDVILLKRAVVHRFDGRSLNIYDQGEIVVNPEGDGAMGLREWWEVKELLKNGDLDCLDEELEGV
jgi:hypothetical protein